MSGYFIIYRHILSQEKEALKNVQVVVTSKSTRVLLVIGLALVISSPGVNPYNATNWR